MSLKKIELKTWHYILIYIVMFILHLFLYPINTIDEFYRYRVIDGMHHGAVLYKDINIITTPLIYYIAGLIFYINNSVITMRIINIVYWIISLLFFHIICKKNNFNEGILFVLNFFILTFLMITGTFYYDYNNLCLMFLVILIYILLYKNFSYQNSFLIALLCCLIILTKQTTGVLITLGTAISILCLNKNKNKDFWKKVLLMVLTGILILSLFAVYLMITNNFVYFCDLCILGVSQFTQNFLLNNSAIIIIFIILMLVCFSYRKSIEKLKNKNNVIYLIFIVVTIINSYPIFDIYHLSIPIMLMFMLFFNSNNILKKIVLCPMLIGCIILFSSSLFENFYNTNNVRCNYKGYTGLMISEYLMSNCDEIEKVSNIYNKEVYVIDKAASAYNYVLGIPNNYYDLLFTGHTGTTSSVEHVKNLQGKDCIIIINKLFNGNYQFNHEIYEYIINNYERIYETENFFVYKP